MSVASDAYLKALRAARAAGYEFSATALAQVELSLRAAAKAITTQLGGSVGFLEEARLSSLRQQIMGVLDVLEVRVAKVTGTAVRTTIDEVLAIHEQVTQKLAQKMIGHTLPGLAARFDDLPIRTLAVMASRPGGTAIAFRTLVNRNIQEAAPALDTLLQSGIVRGVSIDRLAKDVAGLLVKPDSVDLDPYGLKPSDVTGLATVRSDARRIAASETLNALRESNAQAMDESPLVLATQWQLSGRHDGLRSSPDECDVLAESDFFGFGPGFYPPDQWPQAPHPYCGCTAGEVLLRPPSEWNQSKPASPDRVLDPENLDLGGDWSDKRAERAVATLNRIL